MTRRPQQDVSTLSACTESAAELIARFQQRQGVVGVIGLGYVGLPLVATFCEAGFATIGFDVDAAKVTELTQGRSYIRHVPSSRVASLVCAAPPEPGQRAFHPTADYGLLRQCDAIVICVPTPLTEYREPDLSYVVGTAEAIAPHPGW
jgi:UDP-N-acetyl-D-glucosamine dehydrogenase